MRTTILLCTLALATSATAQIIAIADHDLAVKMHAAAPLAVDTVANTVNSGHLQALAVNSFEMLNPYSADITELSGLEGFVNLSDLIVDGAGMTSLDDLPATVVRLSISQCFSLVQITNWPPALQELTMGSLSTIAWDPLPNSIIRLSLGYWQSPPPLGSNWPTDLRLLSLLDVPVSSGTINNLPETVEELSLGNSGVTAILDGNMQPHLPNSLLTLSFRNQPATQLPPLPAGLVTLVVEDCPIPVLPALPANLHSIFLLDLPIAALPALPPDLVVLEAVNCSVEPLPALPAGLTNLSVRNGGLTSVPTLPAGLTGLNLEENLLTALPTLPALLSNLTVSDNPGLTVLPTLPTQNLSHIYADNCALTALPALPAGLFNLRVSNNPLTVLPPLPASLYYLYARSTGITELPALPLGMNTCDVVNCVGLTCSPWLPPNLYTFRVSGTFITCIPNQPATLNINSLGIPLVICDILTPCPTLNPAMMGTSYIDLDNDGLRDAGEPPLPQATVQISPNNFIGGTGTDGRYTIGLDVGTYSVTGIPALYQTLSSAPATATFTAWQQVDSLNDVGYYLTPNIQDLVVDATRLTIERPGFNSQYQLSYRNVGTQVQDGSITFTRDAAMTFVSSTPPPDAINGNVLTWNFTGLQINEQRAIDLTLQTPVGTALGTPIAHAVVAEPLATDQTPTDNNVAYMSMVVGSFDPNDKQVQPTELSPAEVVAGQRVTYTVRFQNTGTFLAERVVITDTLSTDLQWNTMQTVASSHVHAWYINNGVLHVVFDDIMLPDSTSDEPGSHGFFKFSMQPVGTLMLGATVENVANIHFDFNEPIITNAAVFAVNSNVGVDDQSREALLFPNPLHATALLHIAQGQAQPTALQWYDATGRLVRTDAVVREQGAVLVQRGHLLPGLYMLRYGTTSAQGLRVVVQ